MPETPNEILARFHALKAPDGPNGKATDDFGKVQLQIKKFESIYTRNRGSTDRVVAAQAEQWFATVQPLREPRRFQEYVSILQGNFWSIAAPMTGAGATQEQLIRVAKDTCDFDDEFATNTVQGGIITGPDDPQRVLELQAFTRPKSVKLSWRRPSEHCDNITVRRNELDPNKQPKTQVVTNKPPKTIVDNQCRDDYTDKDVEPGKRYKYTVYSYFQGRSNVDPAVIEVLVPIEVQDLHAECKVLKGKLRVELSWKAHAACTQVLIFRKIGGQPKITEDVNPSPADAETQLIKEKTDGQCGSWSDEAVVEGKDHYYLLLALFGPNGRSDGVITKKVPVPQTPGHVEWAKATYEKETNSVLLRWKPLAENGTIDYLVVRSEEGSPPLSVADGELIVETKETKYVDKGEKKELEPGKVYVYTVFCRRQGLLSRECTPTNQAISLHEVNDLTCEPGDREVLLSWNLPKNAVDVLVQRTIAPAKPADLNDKNAHPVLHSAKEARDTGLSNNTSYNYRVYCLYRLPDGREKYSDGLLNKESVTPKEAPPPIRNAVPEREGDKVRIRHEQVNDSKVAIYRLTKPPKANCGDVVSAVDVENWGTPIDSDGPTSAIDKAPKPDWLYYLPVTFRGSLATVGQVKRLPVPEIAGLSAFIVDEGVRLRWQWPDSCESARIMRRIGSWPQNLQDSSATCIDITRDDYDQKGESALDRLPLKAEVQEIYYVAYGRIGNEYAIGNLDGSRCHISAKRLPELEFDWQLNRQRALVRWKFDSVPDNFRGFVLTGNSDRLPFDESDGLELLRWIPEDGSNGDLNAWHERRIMLPKDKRKLHHRVFLLDRSDYSKVRITYPKKPDHLEGRRRPRKQVVCPHCFETFRVWQMRFRYGKDDPNFGNNYPLPKAWWARINPFYRMQLALPNGPDGRRFVDKLCPNCCSEPEARALPYTAGVNRSLMIGLLGASEAGKTHYVVSLVHRLRAMGYELRDIDQNTIDRFGRLETRLFKTKTALTPTQIELDPPLIYSLDGKNGSHSCILALHDTAGENLLTRKDILNRTSYLREADGLIFLVNPQQCVSLARSLGNNNANDLVGLIIDLVIGAFESSGVKMKNGKFPVPLAVVFTKADILRDAGLIHNDLLWHQPIFHEREGGYNIHVHQDTDAAFEWLVADKVPKLFTEVTNHFHDYAFFGVSATGCNADANGHFSRVVPQRVEDPLLWLLFRLGVIDGR